MKLSNLKNIIKEELKKLKEGGDYSDANFTEAGYNEYMNRGGMLNEILVCSCCSGFAAAKAAGKCMDGGGTSVGTACPGGGYNVSCNDAVIGPPVGVGTGTNTGTGKPGLGTDMMAPRRRF